MTGWDAATSKFIVRNPYGVSPNGPSSQNYNTTFEASMADLYTVHATVAYAGSQQGNSNPLVASGFRGDDSTTAMLSQSASYRDAMGLGQSVATELDMNVRSRSHGMLAAA